MAPPQYRANGTLSEPPSAVSPDTSACWVTTSKSWDTPEDDPSNPLNVDAEWRIDNEPWAVEHARIVYDNGAVPAEGAVERYLRPRLEEIARKYGVSLQLGFYAPRWERGGRPPTAAWESIVALAERAAWAMTFEGDAKGNSVSAIEGNPALTLAFFATENAALGDRFTAALNEPLRRDDSN